MLIFAAIAIAAFIIVAGSFIFGHDADHDVDHDHDVGHDFGAEAGDATVSIFSMKVIGTMLMGFGAAGAIATTYGLGYLGASAAGVITGVVLAAIMYAFLAVVAKQQSTSVSRAEDVVGGTGQVTVSIGSEGMGEIGVTCGGRYVNYPARSADGKAIAKGRQVKVVNVGGGAVTVEEVVNRDSAKV
jgi:membrane protein implicated in regulation of membrane protease activity